MSRFKKNNPGCCGCVYCKRQVVAAKECKFIVNGRRVKKVIWEITAIDDPFRHKLGPPPDPRNYIEISGTSGLIKEYVADLEDAQTNIFLDACDMLVDEFVPVTSSKTVFTDGSELNHLSPFDMRVSFSSYRVGGSILGPFFSLSLSTGSFASQFIMNNGGLDDGHDACFELPETEFFTNYPDSVKVKMRHEF